MVELLGREKCVRKGEGGHRAGQERESKRMREKIKVEGPVEGEVEWGCLGRVDNENFQAREDPIVDIFSIVLGFELGLENVR